jgi:hypothetical protein
MAERIVSPGVFTRENDMSFLAQGVGEIGAAFIGPFKQGPAFVPTVVHTATEFENIFGTPDGTYYTDYAVKNYLSEAGTATIVRVAGIGGHTKASPIAIYASGSSIGGKKLIGVLTTTSTGAPTGVDSGFSGLIFSTGSLSGSFFVSASNLAGVSASVLPSATNDLSDVFGQSPFGNKKAYTYTYFEDTANLLAGSYILSASIMGNQDFTGTSDTPAYSEASTPQVKSQLISGQRYDLFQFVTLGHGDAYNTKYKVSISNVKAAGEDGATDYSVFSVMVRSYSDTDKRKSVIETYNNVNLDPASPNYIAKRIGDRYVEIDSNGKITEYGDYANKSKCIRVVVSAPGTFPISAAPFGHGAYTTPVSGIAADASIPTVTYTTSSANNTTTNPIYYAGFDFENSNYVNDNTQYLKAYPAGATVGANVDFGFDSQLSYVMTGSSAADMVKRQFTLAFQGGYDGMNPIVPIYLGTDISEANTQGFNCATSTSSGSLAYQKAINAISNPDEWDINMVVAPGIIKQLHNSTATAIIDMVEARQDAFYIADFSKADATIDDAAEQANAVDTNYAATYYPWVKTVDTNTNKLISVPPSVLLPAVYASNDKLAAEWWAPAGLNRGGIVGAVSVLNRLTHAERDTLYENKVNPIAAFPGQGIVAFGQKTLQDKASALDRINVRRLLITMKKFVASTSRYLVFEQNTAATRSKFLNTVNPYLEAIQQRQGLYAFKVVMDDTNNTPDVIDRNILAGAIYIQPTKTAEFIVIDFNILPTGGAAFSA